MKMRIYYWMLLVLSLTIIIGCSQDRLTPTYEEIGICFETEINPIIVSNCTQSGCHDAVTSAKGYDFTTYEGIMDAVKPFRPNKSELYEYLTGDPADIMPPPPNDPLNANDIALIKEWIEKGAPNTNNCFTTCDTLTNVSFSGDILPVLDRYCIGCHSGNSPQGGIDQSTWTAVKATVDDGSFLGSIVHENGFVPMPLNSPKINSCEILLIETWVNEGALNN